MSDLDQAFALWERGKHIEAERLLVELLQAAPEHPGALRALAEIRARAGRAREASELWRRLATLCPLDAAVLRQLANSLIADQRYGEAVEALRAAITLEPCSSRAYNNLGLAQLRAGDAPAAVISLQCAVTLEPRYALGHFNLGLARLAQNDRTAARAALERALQIEPQLSQARLQLSELLRAEDAAAARRQQVLALETHAASLMTAGRHEDAIVVLSHLLDQGEDNVFLQGMRFRCRLDCCDWTQYSETAAELEAAALRGEYVDLPFSFFAYSQSALAHLRCTQAYVAGHFPAVTDAAAAAAPRADAPGMETSSRTSAQGPARIKVAYLSCDYYAHATAYLIAGLFESHDRSRFEVFALSYGQGDGGAMRARLETSVEHFIDVGSRTDLEIARLMRSMGICIAVDLKGFTANARTGIFAHRAAPLQVNFLGYPGTMGASYIDYIVADRHLIPQDDRPSYSERVIYMPRCYQPNDRRRPRPAAPSRADCGLRPSGFVFCCFNNPYKITPAIFLTWLRLLREIEGSVLWLLAGSAAATRNLRHTAAASGITSDRLVFAGHVDQSQHLARYRHADLFLDTVPCNAHTTASDALWMGVPVLTLTGRTFAGRVATSLLHAVGLPQLCAMSLDEYAETASRLARNPAELATLKAHLESGREGFSLFDSAAYARAAESAYEQIWARHVRGDPPSELFVCAC